MTVTVEEDDELGVVPLKDYERVFAFPTSSVVSTDVSCDGDGFWVTCRVETSPAEDSLASLATGVRRRKKAVELPKVTLSEYYDFSESHSRRITGTTGTR